VWFRNIFLKTLRDYRVAILGWGIGMGLVVVSPMATVAELVKTPEARAELASIAAQFAWNADAVQVDTPGGYAAFKIGIFVFLIVLWPILVGSRMLRGEEERGAMDVLLSLPRARARVALEKLAAMWVALLAMGVLIGLIAYAGGRPFGGTFSLADGLFFGLDLALVCAVFGGLALLISQFTQERGPAAGWTGGLLLIFIVFDMVRRLFPNAEWISKLSPIYYFNLSHPLVSIIDVGGAVVLFGLAVILSAAAVWLFVRRDIGSVVATPAWLHRRQPAARRIATLPEREWSLRSVYSRSLGAMAAPAFWWTLLIAGFAAWMVVVVQQLQARLEALIATSSAMATLLESLGGGKLTQNATFLSAVFQIMPLLLMAYAVTQVNGWASDEEDGRLDLVLATPQSRARVILGRFAALATVVTAMGVVTLIATAGAAAVGGVTLDLGNLAAATLGLIPLGLLIAAIGYLAAGWLRTAADTGLASFVLLLWFFISFIGPELKLPDATLRLSAFYYYGTPLLHGIDVASVAGLLLAGAVALAIGTLRFVRKDIAV
jgi:ABC-2 type transport system permease protein